MWRRRPRPRALKGHGLSHAATTLIPIQAPQGATPFAANLHFSPGTVILSAVASSRSEEATQSKDPYGTADQSTAEGNSDKQVARWGNELPPATALSS
jgi:hypothetical protein